MLSKASVIKGVVGLWLMISLGIPQIARADWSIGIGLGDHHDDRDRHDDRRFYGWHDHPHYGFHIHFLPAGYFTVWVGGVRYFYYDGLYYTYVGDGDYIVVNPPIGAYVMAIPPDFQPLSINGRIYYANDGVYYILTEHHGYKLVEPPVVYAKPPVVVEQPPQVIVQAPAPVVVAPPVDTQDAFPVNVPNNAGGYTTVLIKKSGNGYVGPQGEFYASFPSVSQLKAMYVK